MDIISEEKRIWTIGYGITPQEEFVRRLSEAFPEGDAIIVDIRKRGSGSRNPGNWANQGDEMKETCIKSGNRYGMFSSLHNPHGNTKRGMALYENELDNGHRRPFLNELVKMIVTNPHEKYCLMCSERKPYKGEPHPLYTNGCETSIGAWGGRAENCHRAIVATNVTARAWYDHKKKYQVVHIYGGEA